MKSTESLGSKLPTCTKALNEFSAKLSFFFPFATCSGHSCRYGEWQLPVSAVRHMHRRAQTTHDSGHVVEILPLNVENREPAGALRGFIGDVVGLSRPHQLTESVLSVSKELANAPGGLIGPLKEREKRGRERHRETNCSFTLVNQTNGPLAGGGSMWGISGS